MLDSWNKSVFNDIKNRLQDAAMKLVHAERTGEAFDSQLVIGVRESYGKYLSTKCSRQIEKFPLQPKEFVSYRSSTKSSIKSCLEGEILGYPPSPSTLHLPLESFTEWPISV